MDLVMEDQVRAADSGKEKKLGPRAEFSILPISYLTLPFRVDQRHDHHLNQPFNLSCFQWHFPLFIYIQAMTMLSMHRQIR